MTFLQSFYLLRLTLNSFKLRSFRERFVHRGQRKVIFRPHRHPPNTKIDKIRQACTCVRHGFAPLGRRWAPLAASSNRSASRSVLRRVVAPVPERKIATHRVTGNGQDSRWRARPSRASATPAGPWPIRSGFPESAAPAVTRRIPQAAARLLLYHCRARARDTGIKPPGPSRYPLACRQLGIDGDRGSGCNARLPGLGPGLGTTVTAAATVTRTVTIIMISVSGRATRLSELNGGLGRDRWCAHAGSG